MKERYHKDWLAVDLPRIYYHLQQDPDIQDCNAFFELLLRELDQEILKLKRSPYQMSKPLEYDQLSVDGYYVCKWYSSPEVRGKKGEKPDMRLIYKYDPNFECIYLKAVGFRHVPPPI